MQSPTNKAQGQSNSKPRTRRQLSRRFKRYLRYAAIAIALVWLGTGAYLFSAELRYTSNWTLVLPDRSESSSLAVSEIGNASFSNSSPFGNIGQNPLLTYQKFATSPTVLGNAAASLGIDPSVLGKPRIRLIPQTPLMEFQISALNPEDAEKFGYAIIDALEQKLESLRDDELAARDRHRSQALETYNAQLARSRHAVLHHQASTSLVTTGQFDVLAENIEVHRTLLAKDRARRDQLRGFLANLFLGVGVKKEVAHAAVRLQAREDVRGLLTNYAKALVAVSEISGRVGARHPALTSAQANARTAERDLLKHVDATLKNNTDALREIALLSTGADTGEILRNIVKTSAELAGMDDKVESLERDAQAMELRLKTQAKSAAQLADLERDHSIAEAVFSSALGRISTEKFDVLSAYPLFQIFAAPSRPSNPDRRGFLIALVGAIGASMCIVAGLVIVWLREPLWRRIRKTS